MKERLLKVASAEAFVLSTQRALCLDKSAKAGVPAGVQTLCGKRARGVPRLQRVDKGGGRVRHHAAVCPLAGSAAQGAGMCREHEHRRPESDWLSRVPVKREHICLLLPALLPAAVLLGAGRGLHARSVLRKFWPLPSHPALQGPHRLDRAEKCLCCQLQCCLVLKIPERSIIGAGEATNLGVYHDHKPSRHNSSISGALLLRCNCSILRPAFLKRDVM